jgi:hypothetical protein
MLKHMLLPFAVCAASIAASACPLPQPSAGDSMSAFSQGYNSGGLIGAFGNSSAPDREREANCALWRQLVACGYGADASAALLMNKRDLMPIIAQQLAQCSNRH